MQTQHARLPDEDDLVTAKVACELIGGMMSPITPSTLYRGVKSGRFPAPLKLGAGTSRWRRSEIVALLEHAAAARKEGAA
ncbi:helix-turn-helix transcriptional regulator [Acuticoccus sediminis]|nr:AlpA family phage regulatory protein [Acuticoccus sediminis]